MLWKQNNKLWEQNKKFSRMALIMVIKILSMRFSLVLKNHPNRIAVFIGSDVTFRLDIFSI
jgi:hypothetical protein